MLDSIVVICVIGVGGVWLMFFIFGKLMCMLVLIEVIYIFIGNVKDFVGLLLGGVCIFNVLVFGISVNGSFVVDFLCCEIMLYLLQDDCLLYCLLQVCECCQVVLLVGVVYCELLVVVQLLFEICQQVCVICLLQECVLIVVMFQIVVVGGML